MDYDPDHCSPGDLALPVEAKPLFRPDALRPHLKAFQLPRPLETYRAILAKWAEMLASGKADRFKEQEILGDFLNDVFCGVLDYARPADDPDRHTISREKHVQVDGKFADAVLGDFREAKEQFVVALEGKGPLDPLDRPYAGRHMSAVDQGYRYAINLPCDWIIVTSIRQTRLYYKGCDQRTLERFDTERLADRRGAAEEVRLPAGGGPRRAACWPLPLVRLAGGFRDDGPGADEEVLR